MDKIKKMLLVLIVFILLGAGICYAEMTLLGDGNGLIFSNNTITDFTQGDIGFLGLEDKEEVYERPMIYANALSGKISPMKEGLRCSELDDADYSAREKEINVGKDYCVRIKDIYDMLDKDRQVYAVVNVIGLENNWSWLNISWSIEKRIDEDIDDMDEDSGGLDEGLSVELDEEIEDTSSETGLDGAVDYVFMILVSCLVIIWFLRRLNNV